MDNIQALLESSKYAPLTASDSAAMKLMLENTEKEHARLVNEGTLSGDVAQFTPILMPMVRRVYPNLIANELLGVQPMSMPTGFIYALTHLYTGSQDSSAKGGKIVEGDAAHSEAVYSEELKNGRVLSLVPASTADLTDGGALGTQDTIVVYSNEAAFGRILKGYTGPIATNLAEGLGTNMKEVGFRIAKKTVEAKSRALKGQYTVEMYQDLKAQHGLMADEEIMSLMSYEMQAEIDREIIDFVNDNATQLGDTYMSFNNTVGTDGRWEVERYRSQVIRISTEAAQIGLDTKRGQGNVLLVSPKVATMLEQVGTFQTATQQSNVSAPVSGGVAGTFDGRFKVIVDQYATSDYCTVLYKGADRRDAMGFFAPYVPMSFTKVTHADSGQPAVIAKTRYGLATIPGHGLEPNGEADNSRAKLYARSFGVDFTNTVLG